jgi:uncharacterized protein DUF3617
MGMRALASIALLLAAGCGGAPAENKAEAIPAALAPGQWELTAEVTGYSQTAEGRPKIDTPAGSRTTASLCVAEGRQIPAAYFGGEGYRCRYGDYYARNGRLNVTLMCRRDGLTGDVTMTAEGSFQAASAEFRRTARTTQPADGGVTVASRVTARRTGECTPDAGEGADRNKQG